MDDYELEKIADDIINDSFADEPDASKDNDFLDDDVASDIRTPEPKHFSSHEDSLGDDQPKPQKSHRPKMVDSFRRPSSENRKAKDSQTFHEDISDQVENDEDRDESSHISEFVSSHSKIAHSDQPAFRTAPSKKISTSAMPIMGQAKPRKVEPIHNYTNNGFEAWDSQPSHHEAEPTWSARPVDDSYDEDWDSDPLEEKVSSLGTSDKIDELLSDYDEPAPIYSSSKNAEEEEPAEEIKPIDEPKPKKKKEKAMILEETVVEDGGYSDSAPTFASVQKRSHRIRTMIISLIIVTGLVGVVISVISLTSNSPKEPDQPTTISPYTAKDTPSNSKYNINDAETLNLSSRNDEVTISKEGAYRLTGNLDHSLIVNAQGEVALYLDNIVINSPDSAAIKNLSNNQLTIYIIANTTNSLVSNGSSEQNACIYSDGPLVINGDESGTLNIAGQQENGKGIAAHSSDLTISGGSFNITSNDDGISTNGSSNTVKINGGVMNIVAGGDGIESSKDLIIDGGQVVVIGSDEKVQAGFRAAGAIEINGGYVFAMGTDTIEAPVDGSKQKSFALSFDEAQKAEGTFYLVESNSAGDVRSPMFSIYAAKSFRNLIVSAPELVDKATYRIYQGGNFKSSADSEEVGSIEGGVLATAGGYTDFQITTTVNKYAEGVVKDLVPQTNSIEPSNDSEEDPDNPKPTSSKSKNR